MRLSLSLPCGSRMEPISYTTPPQYMIIGGLRVIEHWAIRLLGEVTVMLSVDPIHVHRNRLLTSELGVKVNIDYSGSADAEVNPCIVPYTSNVRAVIRHISNNESVACGSVQLVKVNGGAIVEDCNIGVLKGPWDIIRHNTGLLGETISMLMGMLGINGNVALVNSKVSSDVKLNTNDGPVMVIGSTLDAPIYIRGPALIGLNTAISPFTYVRQGTVAYMNVRLSGEVKNSILDCCTLKEHYGYLGDSYVGKWVNFGAGTTVSNLKNTMGSVRFMGVDTGMVKLGPIIGDWVKTGINTSIMGGKAIGPGAHVYGLVAVDVPPFTIYNGVNGRLVAMDRGRVRDMVLRWGGDADEADYALRVFDLTQGLRVGINVGEYRLT